MKNITTSGQNAELVKALLQQKIEFLIVGGLAVAFYLEIDDETFKRSIGVDIDILIDKTSFSQLKTALFSLGLDISWDESLEPIRIPIPHNGINADIITPKQGIDFTNLWERREEGAVDSSRCWFISKLDLLNMKRTALKEATDPQKQEKHQRDIQILLKDSN